MYFLKIKTFISVEKLTEAGIKIPYGTTLYHLINEEVAGNYIEHVQTEHQNFHTMTRPGFQSVPFVPSNMGILYEQMPLIDDIQADLDREAKNKQQKP